MKKRLTKSVLSVVLAGALSASMAMTAMAADPQNVTIKKTIEKQTDVFLPATSFTFTVEQGTAVPAASGKPAVYQGPVGGVTITDANIASAPRTIAEDIGQASVTLTDTATLQVNSSAFTAPGVYRYVVKETAGTYEGMTYSTDSKFFDVYVKAGAGGAMEAYSYFFADPSAATGKNDGIFTNNYDKDNTSADLNKLKITKTVTGNQGDQNKEFEFTVTVTGSTGEKFYMTYGNNQTLELTSGTAATIRLKHGQEANITGLSTTDTYVVAETDYSADGYVKTVSGAENGTGASTDKTVAYTNERTVNTPTGIAMSFAPYVLALGLASVLLFAFMRRRRAE